MTCESQMDRLLKNLVNYGNVEKVNHGQFEDEEFIDVHDFGQALKDIIIQMKAEYDTAFHMSTWTKGPSSQEELTRTESAVTKHAYKYVGQMKGSLERTIRFTWDQMRLENSLQIEQSAVGLTLAILREADDLTEATNHNEVTLRKEDVLLVTKMFGDHRPADPDKKMGEYLLVVNSEDVVRAEEYGFFFYDKH
jgi:hypothetical protein